MGEAAAERMTPEAFLVWSKGREGRWELVHGIPVGMAGAGRTHDRIVVNTLGQIYRQLEGKTCQGFTADTFVRIPNGNFRMPDTGVDCGTGDADDRFASDPRLVVEVLSPSTKDFDMYGKLDEYKRVPSLRYIVLLDSDFPQATVWERRAGEWSHALVRGLDAEIKLPELEIVLPMAKLYAQVAFPARPRLVAPPG